MPIASSLISLSSNWSFTQIGGGEGTKDGEWIQTAEFPTTVHVELLRLNKIPNPFTGLHEWDVQWVGEAEWAFKTILTVTQEQLLAPNVDLVFDGLDTFATVKLNDLPILETNNQFLSYRVDIKKHARPGRNELLISFESAWLKGRDLEKRHGKLKLWNGDSSRLHVRKAGYNYGWDWGPVLMTAGPWRPVYLHVYSTRISELYAQPQVSADLTSSLNVTVKLSHSGAYAAQIALKKKDGKEIARKTGQRLDSGSTQTTFDLSNDVELWYPVGYGDQPLYDVEIVIADPNENVVDTSTQTIAFRRARVVEDSLIDEEGRTFLFEINNIRIFCGGSNWIPPDSFLTTMTPERYRAWLQLLVNGNQNMIRVWGGGTYEPDVFYDICDELGIMVWQDFMFGCGQYPAYDSFVSQIREEADQAVKRLRHHPSLVIFAGNNEDYQLAESSGLELDYSDETSDFRKTSFPARYIYERVLPEAVKMHSDVHYHRSSPYSGYGKATTDQRYGDLHQWNVWHGSQEPWNNWDILAGRFVSEFGMEAYPDTRTVDYWLGGNMSERYPQSRTTVNHNKADGFERRLELYLVENFKHSFDMNDYIYYTQIMQAETLAAAYRLWRRNWRGPGREYTAGALVWQINDCWPTTSWAIVDYFMRPKPAYYAIARELRPYTVGMTRKEKKTFADDRTAAFFTIETEIEIWGTNSALQEKKATLEVTCFDLHDSTWREIWSKDVILAPNSSTELFKGELPGQPKRTKASQVPKTIVCSARLLDGDRSVLSRYSNWPEPFKYIHFPSVEELGLQWTVGPDGDSVELSVKKPVKGVILDVDGGEVVKWSDQAIDLVPDDPQVVKAPGLNGRTVKARYLHD